MELVGWLVGRVMLCYVMLCYAMDSHE